MADWNTIERASRTWRACSILIAAVLGTASCAGPEARQSSLSAQSPLPGLALETKHLAVELAGIVDSDTPDSLVQDAGWREYRLTLVNRFAGPLTIRNVRLLTAEGRYVESAGNYSEIVAPPDPAEMIAGNVVRQGAGVAAGQFIPFGGTLVGLVTNSASALSTQKQTDARRAFALRKLKKVELAPGGKVSGSAFLPVVPNVRFLVIDYAAGNNDERLEIPFDNPSIEFD